MRRFLIILTSLAVTTALLAGCGHHRPATGAGKAQLPSGSGGTTKTGKPYKVMGKWYYPAPQAAGYDATGIASWYGKDFHGKRTANGERYDMHALSAAHKTLPLPTLVRVTNLENGRSVVVRVNDRGPFVKSRIIDLSYAAAKALGYANKGTARVRVQALKGSPPVRLTSKTQLAAAPAAIPATHAGGRGEHTYIQLGAFSIHDNATRLLGKLIGQYPNTFIQPVKVKAQTFYRVRLGPFDGMKGIENVIFSLQSQGYRDGIVVVE